MDEVNESLDGSEFNKHFDVIEEYDFGEFVAQVDQAIAEGWQLHGPVTEYQHALIPDPEPPAYIPQYRTGYCQYIVRYPKPASFKPVINMSMTAGEIERHVRDVIAREFQGEL